jgi:maleate cis-trans isomerase
MECKIYQPFGWLANCLSIHLRVFQAYLSIFNRLYPTCANLLGDTIVANILYHCVTGRLILTKNNNMEEEVRKREEGDRVKEM